MKYNYIANCIKYKKGENSDMKKDIIIVDLILIVLFVILISSNIFKLTAIKMVQPLFMVLLGIHIIQHWRTLVAMIKNLFKKRVKNNNHDKHI